MIHDTPNSHNDAGDPVEPRHAAGPGTPGVSEGADEGAVPVEPAPEPVHRWLDGESVNEQDLEAPDAKPHVKFWAKLKEETDRRRRMATPRGLDVVIMQKLEPKVEKDD